MLPETTRDIKKEWSFNEAHPAAIRIWHWITAATLSASILLVILGSTMFRTRNNIDMVQEQLQGKGVTVTVDQARSVFDRFRFGFGLVCWLFCLLFYLPYLFIRH